MPQFWYAFHSPRLLFNNVYAGWQSPGRTQAGQSGTRGQDWHGENARFARLHRERVQLLPRPLLRHARGGMSHLSELSLCATLSLTTAPF